MKLRKLLSLTAMAVLSASAQVVSAQTPPSLNLRLFAGVNITGSVGDVYAVQSNADLAQTNGWNTVAFVRLPATNYLFIDTSAPANGSRFYRALVQSSPTNMVFILFGNFRLGSPTNEFNRSSDEGPQTTVTITHGFWMGKYEVTQREYLAVVGSNPSQFTGDLSRPVETVSFFDATNYCVLRTLQDLAAGKIPPGTHYRLPTEAEWEYAARAGSKEPVAGSLAIMGWCGANSLNRTHPVGQKDANAFGLYDMYGNVWEWCQSQYKSYPYQATDGREDLRQTDVHVLRGGSWESSTTACRSSYRRRVVPDPRTTGFRIALNGS